MPTELNDRDVNEGDDTKETGGSSKKQNAHMENSEKANAVFDERWIERMKTEDPLSCFKEPITSDLSFEEIIANIYSRQHRLSEVSKSKEKEAM